MSQPIEPRDPRHSNPYGLTPSPQEEAFRKEQAEKEARFERIWQMVSKGIGAQIPWNRPFRSVQQEGPVYSMTWEQLLAFPAHGSQP